MLQWLRRKSCDQHKPIILLLKGLPGSGKSTLARYLMEQQPGKWKRVNKDDLRSMLDLGEWTKKNEHLVLAVRDLIILESVDAGYSVIVDDTNLEKYHKKHISKLLKGKAQVSQIDLTDLPLQDCLERNSLRTGQSRVPDGVIHKMYEKYVLPKVSSKQFEFIVQDPYLPHAIICDLDGTLALIGDRNPYDSSKCEVDHLNTIVRDLLYCYRACTRTRIILVSGRSEDYRQATLMWLDANDIKNYELLLMRPSGDSIEDSTVKHELYTKHIHDKYYIEAVIDDRPRVINMWRSIGLFTLDCNQLGENF